MISRVLESQKKGDITYYLVEWAELGRKPSWTTKEVNPEVASLIQQTTISQPQSAANVCEGGFADNTVISDYLKWKSTHTVKQAKQKEREKYIQKLQREGVQRYDKNTIERLEKKRDELKKYSQIANPKDTQLDILVKNVEGVQESKFKQLCFVVTFVGRANKYVVPIKKMKKHFPNALCSYLEDAIRTHKSQDSEYLYQPMQIQQPQGIYQANDSRPERDSYGIYDSEESESPEERGKLGKESSRQEEKESEHDEDKAMSQQEQSQKHNKRASDAFEEEESFAAESGMREEDWDMDAADPQSED